MIQKVLFGGLTVMFAVSVGMLALEDSVSAASTPKIVSDTIDHDFGEMEAGSEQTHTFTITNEGDADLVIQDVKTSCGCTVATPDDKTIEPGESTELPATLKVPQRSGPTRKTITISSNDPERPMLKLSVGGTTIVKVEVQPRVIAFQQLEQDEQATQTAAIWTDREDVTFDITGASVDSEHFTIETTPVEPGKRYEISVSTNPPLPTSRAMGRAFIRTNVEGAEEHVLQIVANVLGKLNVTPNRLILNEQIEGPLTRYILVRPGVVKEFDILEVTSTLEPAAGADQALEGDQKEDEIQLTFDVQERQPNFYYIEVNGIQPSPELDGKDIIIKTNAPGMEEIKIPFNIVSPQQPVTPAR